MRINNNIMALNTHRQYGIANAGLAGSSEKLSSGFRINRAGDDAAGLAISEKMRAQIRGLNMASKNSQDAISLVQTAEGALQESHNILQRMRELAVQSSSDTNHDKVDREALNEEFQQLLAEIDDTANKARFNGMGTIDGTFSGKSNPVEMTDANEALALAADNHIKGLDKVFGEGNVKLTAGDEGLIISGKDKEGNTKELTLSYQTIIDSKGGKVFDVGEGVSIELKDAFAETVTTNAAAKTAITTNYLKGATGTETVALTKEPITYSGAINGSKIDGLENVFQGDVTIDVASDKIRLLGKDLDGKEKMMEFTVAELDGKQSYTRDGITLNFADKIVAAKNTTTGVLEDALLTTTKFGATSTAKIPEGKGGKDFVVQTGANKGDTLSINIDAMNCKTLGFGEMDKATEQYAVKIGNRENASDAIKTVDDAINKVSTQRSKLGALQNRLNHKISNLDNSAENLQAAESRIRDLDMAKEMSNYTKQNILIQASTSMLAQANQAPQNVLKLLG